MRRCAILALSVLSGFLCVRGAMIPDPASGLLLLFGGISACLMAQSLFYCEIRDRKRQTTKTKAGEND